MSEASFIYQEQLWKDINALVFLLKRCLPFVHGDMSHFQYPEDVEQERAALLKAMEDYV